MVGLGYVDVVIAARVGSDCTEIKGVNVDAIQLDETRARLLQGRRSGPHFRRVMSI
jgi:UDP-N-acetyl-D-mannosaminuronate dehydrogenase